MDLKDITRGLIRVLKRQERHPKPCKRKQIATFISTFFLDKQEKFWDDVYKNEVNIKVLNNKYQITDSQLREDHVTFIKIKL